MVIALYNVIEEFTASLLLNKSNGGKNIQKVDQSTTKLKL